MGPPVLRRLLNLPPVRSAASTHLFVLAVRAHYQHLIRYWSRERNAIKHNGYWVCCHGNVWTARPPLNWPSVMRETNTNTLKCQKTVAAPASHPQQLHFVHHEDNWRWLRHAHGHECPSCHAITCNRKLQEAAPFASLSGFHGRTGKLATKTLIFSWGLFKTHGVMDSNIIRSAVQHLVHSACLLVLLLFAACPLTSNSTAHKETESMHEKLRQKQHGALTRRVRWIKPAAAD